MGKNKILIAPLNWGLGHATRCIPIINTLIKQNFEPVIASDGDALLLLQKEFPKLKFYQLPSYGITYPKRSKLFFWHLAGCLPRFIKTAKLEHQTINKIVCEEQISGIISDNRFGCYHTDVKSVYITHQINVFAGIFTWLTSKIHQKIIAKFDECWVPDQPNHLLSDKLSKSKINNIRFIGILSRFKPQTEKTQYDYLVLLSGIETQRQQLEKILIRLFKNSDFKVLIIQGKVEDQPTTTIDNNLTIINFDTSELLQKHIAQSKIVISRSGYSTIMDLAVMGKKAIFIPTPGQSEQLYLAKNLALKKIALAINQQNLNLANLKNVTDYSGFIPIINQKQLLLDALQTFN